MKQPQLSLDIRALEHGIVTRTNRNIKVDTRIVNRPTPAYMVKEEKESESEI